MIQFPFPSAPWGFGGRQPPMRGFGGNLPPNIQKRPYQIEQGINVEVNRQVRVLIYSR